MPAANFAIVGILRTGLGASLEVLAEVGHGKVSGEPTAEWGRAAGASMNVQLWIKAR
jgi:hypothetical protein